LIGESYRVLSGFDVPDEVATEIARRAGALFGTKGPIDIRQIEKVVIANLGQSGMPNWDGVLTKMAEMSQRVYQGKTPFVK